MKKGKLIYTLITAISIIITLLAVCAMVQIQMPQLKDRMHAGQAVEEPPMEEAIEAAPMEEPVAEAPAEEIPDDISPEQLQVMEDAGEVPAGTTDAMFATTDHTLILNAWGGRTEMEVIDVDTGEPQQHGFGATVFSRGKVFSYREEYIESDNCEIVSCIARHEDGRTSNAWEVYTAEHVEFVDLPAGEEPQVEPNAIYFFMHNSETIQGGSHWVILYNYELVDDVMPSEMLFEMPVETNIYAQVNWDEAM